MRSLSRRAQARASLRCDVCLLQTPVCLCSQLPHVATRTRWLIVRHDSETHKPSNSGRLVSLALPNSELVCHGDRRLEPTSRELAHRRARPGTWLLFPEGEAQSTPFVGEPPARVIVLDGTWQQARRMRQRLVALRGLPILSLAAPSPPRERLRKEHLPTGMSTLEAVAGALALLEGADVAAPLYRLYDEFVARSIATAKR